MAGFLRTLSVAAFCCSFIMLVVYLRGEGGSINSIEVLLVTLVFLKFAQILDAYADNFYYDDSDQLDQRDGSKRAVAVVVAVALFALVFTAGCASLFSPVDDAVPERTRLYYRVLEKAPDACADYRIGDKFYLHRAEKKWYVIPAADPTPIAPTGYELMFYRSPHCGPDAVPYPPRPGGSDGR